MNHQEAKNLLSYSLPEDSLSLIKVEVFRLSWQGKGYNIIAEESGYDHDYVRKAGSQLWAELSTAMGQSVNKRNFRTIMEAVLKENQQQQFKQPDFPGTAIAFSSPFYIERSSEEARSYNEIMKAGSIVRVKGPVKMGKSSLANRVIDHAISEGMAHVNLDFNKADRKIMADTETLLKWMCLQITLQLKLENKLDEYWHDLIGSKICCTNYLEQYILPSIDCPLVLVFNEINLLFDFEESYKDLFPLLRSWHEESKHNINLQPLRLLLIYSTEAYVQLDINLSPFNVGLPIELAPFSGEQIAQLAQVYGFKWQDDGALNSPVTQLKRKLGGHPYLVQLALYHLATSEDLLESPSNTLQTLLDQGHLPTGIFADFLQNIQHLINESEVCKGAFNAFKKDEAISRQQATMLENIGVVFMNDDKPVAVSPIMMKYLKEYC